MCHRGSYMTRDGTFTVPGTGLCPGGGGWWGQCGAQRAELRDERAPVAPVPQQRGPELKAASYFATPSRPRSVPGQCAGEAVPAHELWRAWPSDGHVHAGDVPGSADARELERDAELSRFHAGAVRDYE